MKAIDIINELCALGPAPEYTCDTVKAGDPEKEIKRVAVTMFPNIKTVREATAWGADMLLVHEPTYYDHMEEGKETEVSRIKREMIEKSGMTVFRFHDIMHAATPDGIAEGEMHYLGLAGRLEMDAALAAYKFTLDEPKTALELARIIEERLGLENVRIAGEKNKRIKTLALRFGAPGRIFDTITDDRYDSMLIGEVCEWKVCEYVRDAAELGINKSVIVMGHVGSERDGMKYLCEKLAKAHPDIAFKYFKNEEVYGYTK